jgi:mono/diheme cytochrome c family protein
MKTQTRLASVLVGGALAAVFLTAAAKADDAGQKAFDANKCSNCHSIEKLKMARKIQSEKTAGPDLSTIGDKHDAAWITKWCMREVEKDGKQHKSEYKGTKEDLQAIANWLATLKSGS